MEKLLQRLNVLQDAYFSDNVKGMRWKLSFEIGCIFLLIYKTDVTFQNKNLKVIKTALTGPLK